MTLLDHYVRSVGRYLPRSAARTDILAELAELLQSALDEQETVLGRPLTEAEQQEVLAAHGNPIDVAARYGGTRLGLAFGRQIISAESFPLYLIALAIAFGCTIVVNVLTGLFVDTPARVPVGAIGFILLCELAAITTVFAGIDTLWRRGFRTAKGPRLYVSFPPPYRQPIPRSQSVSGLIVLTTTAIWWATLPSNPALILFGAAGTLQLTTAWQIFYWPLLLLLLAGIIQRATTLAKPDWNALQFFTRLGTNGLMLVMVYPILQSYPYVAVAANAADPSSAGALAERVNGVIWSQVLLTGGLYWLFWTGFHVWLCTEYLRSIARRGMYADGSTAPRRHV
jgi:hypothetical protein